MSPMVFIKAHPVETGLGVVAVIAIFFLLTRSSGGSSASSGDSGAAAYYAAQANQSNNSAAIQIAQDNDVAQTAQTQIAADASTTNNTTWANQGVALANINSATSIATGAQQEYEYNNMINYNNAVLTQVTALGNAGNYNAASMAAGGFIASH